MSPAASRSRWIDPGTTAGNEKPVPFALTTFHDASGDASVSRMTAAAPDVDGNAMRSELTHRTSKSGISRKNFMLRIEVAAALTTIQQ